jgi:enoyl-CoA hydratase/carnithine racemase
MANASYETGRLVVTNQNEGPTTGPPIPFRAPERDSSPVARELDGHVAVLTMQHRPHNFIGVALFEALIDGIRWAAEQKARAVLLRSGLRNFCAGADMGMFESAGRGVAPDLDVTELQGVFDRLPIPIVAAVHGACVGGGLELALATDLIIAAESAKIGLVEATLGLNPQWGGIQRITERAGAARAKEIALLARRYDARTLEKWNIINRVVADEQLPDASAALAHELANGPTVAHASTKAMVSYAVSHGVQETDDAMRELQKDLWKSNDAKLGLASYAVNGPGAARFEGR